MQKRLMSYGLGLALGALLAWPAAAQSGAGMNSNKPRANDKLGSKEPAYKGMNSNAPASAGMNSNKPGARPGLSGVNPNDLKLKPNEKFSGKEPAK